MVQDTFLKQFKLLKEQMLESINLFTVLLEDVEFDMAETSEAPSGGYTQDSIKERMI